MKGINKSVVAGIFAISSMMMFTTAQAVTYTTTKTDLDLTATFLGSDAGYNSNFLLFVNGEQRDVTISNTSKEGTTFDFGSVQAGDKISFGLDVLNTKETWLSNGSNSDSMQHFQTSVSEKGELIIGVEDLKGLGDKDFNDVMVSLENVSPVPEPETYAMLLVGLGVLAFSARKPKALHHS